MPAEQAQTIRGYRIPLSLPRIDELPALVKAAAAELEGVRKRYDAALADYQTRAADLAESIASIATMRAELAAAKEQEEQADTDYHRAVELATAQALKTGKPIMPERKILADAAVTRERTAFAAAVLAAGEARVTAEKTALAKLAVSLIELHKELRGCIGDDLALRTLVAVAPIVAKASASLNYVKSYHWPHDLTEWGLTDPKTAPVDPLPRLRLEPLSEQEALDLVQAARLAEVEARNREAAQSAEAAEARARIELQAWERHLEITGGRQPAPPDLPAPPAPAPEPPLNFREVRIVPESDGATFTPDAIAATVQRGK
jgi:hypothetical protein